MASSLPGKCVAALLRAADVQLAGVLARRKQLGRHANSGICVERRHSWCSRECGPRAMRSKRPGSAARARRHVSARRGLTGGLGRSDASWAPKRGAMKRACSQPGGTGLFTRAAAATVAPSPMVTLPSTVHLAPRKTPSATFGCRSCSFEVPVAPRVTSCIRSARRGAFAALLPETTARGVRTGQAAASLTDVIADDARLAEGDTCRVVHRHATP